MKNERYIFNWDEIPGKDDDHLKEFLKKDFCIDWVENAKIEKIDERNRTLSTKKIGSR